MVLKLTIDNKSFPFLLSFIRKHILKEKYNSSTVRDLLTKSGSVNFKICLLKKDSL